MICKTCNGKVFFKMIDYTINHQEPCCKNCGLIDPTDIEVDGNEI